jgi:hypothetical protein
MKCFSFVLRLRLFSTLHYLHIYIDMQTVSIFSDSFLEMKKRVAQQRAYVCIQKQYKENNRYLEGEGEYRFQPLFIKYDAIIHHCSLKYCSISTCSPTKSSFKSAQYNGENNEKLSIVYLCSLFFIFEPTNGFTILCTSRFHNDSHAPSRSRHVIFLLSLLGTTTLHNFHNT